jgi:hypothetical protein
MYDASKDSEHLVVCFESLFEFQVFVPERMSKEVKSNTTGAALEKPVPAVVSMKYTSRGVQERRGWRKANMAYACACDAVCSSASNDNSKTSIEYNAKAVEVGSCEGKERLNIQCEK